MIIGVSKEIKQQEYRVTMPPSGACQIMRGSHRMLAERIAPRQLTGLLTLLTLFFFAGCGAYQSIPANWAKRLPGIYEGMSSTFRETVEFKSDGTFSHKVTMSDRNLIDETGKWSTSSGHYVVNLNHFTQFYDPLVRKFSETGKEFVSYEFRPLPDGETFNKISASVEFEYTLTRKNQLP